MGESAARTYSLYRPLKTTLFKSQDNLSHTHSTKNVCAMVESLFSMSKFNFNARNIRLPRVRIQRAHLALMASAASVFLFIAGLKPFQIGLWFQSEPVTLGLFAFAAIAAAIIAFDARTRASLTLALKQPAIRLLIALALWSLVCSLFAPFPMRSLMGIPEIGEGVFSMVSVVLLTIAAFHVWQIPSQRLPLVLSCVAAGAVVVALQSLTSTTDWQPVIWPDFAAFIAIFIMIILLAYPVDLTRKHFAAAGAIAVIGLLASHNFAAALSLGMLLPLAGLLVWLKRRLNSQKKFERHARQIITGMALLPVLITLITLNTSGMRAINFYAGKLLNISNFKDVAFEQGSLGSRALFNRLVIDAVTDKPSRLLVGNGWGSFSDVSFNYVLTDGIRIYNEQAVWAPNWNLVTGNTFHSHNSFLEALLSTGIVGLIMYCLLPVLIIRHLPHERMLILGPLWASLFLLSMFWFMLPVTLPFMAIALAASLDPSAVAGKKRRQLPRQAVQGVCLVLIATLGLAMWVQNSTARTADQLLDGIQKRMPEPTDRNVLRDHHRGNHHLWWLTASLADFIQNKHIQRKPITQADVAWYNEMLTMVGQTVDAGTADDRLLGTHASMYNDLIMLYSAPQWSALRLQRLPQWKKAVLDAIHGIPTRGDLATMYGLFFMERASPKEKPQVREAMTKQVFDVTEEVLHNNPDDPVALWFSGLALLQHSDTETLGFKRLHRALDLQAERYVPVNEAARKVIEAQRKR